MKDFMNKNKKLTFKASIKKFFGFVFIIIGIIGFILPIIPGFVFVLLGLAMVSPRFELGIKHVYRRYKMHRNLKKAIQETIVMLKN